MFIFDASKFVVRRLKLKAISKSTIDPRVTFEDDDGQLTKMCVPVSIARRIKIRLKNVTRFTTFYPCDVAFVDDRIVSMDVPDGIEYKSWKEGGEWTSRLQVNSNIVGSLNGWLYDGQYVYRTTGPVQGIEGSRFGSQKAETYNLYVFGEQEGRELNNMVALAYRDPEDETWVTSVPVTRGSGNLLQLTGDTETNEGKAQYAATATDVMIIDINVYPNLRFVNYAAKVLSEVFGYSTIEPLGLPLLMIEHRTFNLGGMPTPVQATSPAPFKFTQGLAWLIGLFGRVETLEQLIAIKSSMKMYLTKGNTNHRTNSTKVDDEVSTKVLIESVRRVFDSAELIEF